MDTNKKQKLINLTMDLISYQSTVDYLEAKNAIVDYVQKSLDLPGVEIKQFQSRGLPSLVATLGNDDNPSMILNGHLDVVPASIEEFHPKIKENRIHGRGSGDMKAACAVMMEILRDLSAQKNIPSIGLMLTTDEEMGGFDGVGYLVKEKGYKPNLALIPDGGKDLSTLVVNNKGVLHLKIKAFGKAAHGSRPFWGENAVDKLMDIYQKLRKIIPQLNEQKWHNTMNLGKIQGGEATNKVPDYAEMDLDIRFVSKEDREKILQQIGGITSDFEITAEGPPFIQNQDDFYIKNYKEIAEKVVGEKITFYRHEGSSDARFFSEAGVPVISTKINCDNIHAEGEWVDIDSMENFYNIVSSFVNFFFENNAK